MNEQKIPKGFVHQPKNTMPQIDEIYAFVSVDASDGNEGVCAVNLGGVLMPLIAADPARLEALRPHAKQIAQMLGQKIRLVKFTTRQVIEEF
jgi:hypothetical protein